LIALKARFMGFRKATTTYVAPAIIL